MKADYHVHSHFSDDSFYPMEQVVKDAIGLGLDELAFTDHVDYGLKTDQNMEIFDLAGRRDLNTYIERPNIGILYNVDYENYFPMLEEMRKKYGDQIQIRSGLELGIQKETLPVFEALMKRYKDQLDFVLLSVHQLDNMEFWTGDYQKDHTQLELYENYYKELLWLVQNFKDYNVLAHLDLINRYDTYKEEFDYAKVEPIIEEILKTVIADGKGIELNTSSLRYGVKGTTPSRSILQMYKDLGGEIITIGSDSHKPEHLGTLIDEHKELLKDLGFKNVYTFEKMKPIAHSLEESHELS